MCVIPSLQILENHQVYISLLIYFIIFQSGPLNSGNIYKGPFPPSFHFSHSLLLFHLPNPAAGLYNPRQSGSSFSFHHQHLKNNLFIDMVCSTRQSGNILTYNSIYSMYFNFQPLHLLLSLQLFHISNSFIYFVHFSRQSGHLLIQSTNCLNYFNSTVFNRPSTSSLFQSYHSSCIFLPTVGKYINK